MTQSDAVNWSVAILLSLLVHSMILVGSDTRMGEEDAAVIQAPSITRISFNNLLQDAGSDVPQMVEKPKPKPKPKPVKKVKAKPLAEKPAETAPLAEKPVMQQKALPENVEPMRQVAVQQRVQGRQASRSSDNLIQQERQKYLGQLMSHIESFKYYPRAARRRALEGEVKVSFIILDDGSYEQLSLEGRHSILVKATRLALESAIPLPVPPEDFSLPAKAEFIMSYSLTD